MNPGGGDGWETASDCSTGEEKGGKLLPNAQTLGHPAALIVMETCRLVGALATGREDE